MYRGLDGERENRYDLRIAEFSHDGRPLQPAYSGLDLLPIQLERAGIDNPRELKKLLRVRESSDDTA
jgi:hypothetical protein